MQKTKPHKFFKKKDKLALQQDKQEKKVKEKSNYKFPSIFRVITAYILVIPRLFSPSFWKKKKNSITAMLVLCLLVFIGLGSIRAYRHYAEREKILGEREHVLVKIAYWKRVVAERSGYRDGYFQLAVLYYQLGQNDNAKTYLLHAMQVDPNFQDGMKLEELLKE